MANIKIKLNPDQEIVSTIREVTGEEERIEMEIRKRNGESVPFQQEKIFNAMKKAFDGQGREIGSRELEEILATVLNNLSVTVPLTVERVQDEVERTLMECGHYEVAKPKASLCSCVMWCRPHQDTYAGSCSQSPLIWLTV